MKRKRPSRLAIVDHLTGLYNRRHFDRCLKNFVIDAKKKKNHFSLLMLDIDKFKMVSDKYGHIEGDKVLSELAKILKESVRKIDVCFRYGGDEIVVILPNAEKASAEHIAKRLKEKVEQHKFFIVATKHELHLALSIGLAVFPDDGLEPKKLIKKADELLYKVKGQITAPFILETKFIPPLLKENVISRPPLLLLLKEKLIKKLLLIVADAGYGKTTLLTQLIKDQKFPYVFYDLDKTDSDFVVFLAYLILGLEQIQTDLITRTKGLLKQGGEAVSNYVTMMGTLINELVEKRKQELFIILDDYHNLAKDSLVHQALDYFIDHMPDIVHVVIASRAVPPFTSIPKWRSKQDLFELSREGIRFTEEEVKALLTGIYKTALTEDELTRLSEKTEGWITGIQLIIQSSGKDGCAIKETLNGYLETSQPLFEYFANEIYNGEPLEIKDFLKKSSILDVMTTEMCDHIFEAKDSEKLLKDLERRNLFLSVVGKGEYKYHRLFREFLLGQIKDEGYKQNLHLRAAEYYQRQGKLERAIEHYLEARSYECAGKAITHVVDVLEDQGRFSTLHGWLERIPSDVILKSSRLVLLRGTLYREQGRWDEARHLYDQAERLFYGAGDLLNLADIHVVRGGLLWSKGDYRGALKDLRRALTLCPSSKVQMKAAILNTMGLVFRGLGDLKKARLFLRKADHLSEASKDRFTMMSVRYNLATLASYKGCLREAYVQYQKILEMVREIYHYKVGMVFGNAAITAMDLNREVSAKQILERGQALCRAYEDLGSRVVLTRAEGYLHLYHGQLDLAEARFQGVLEESQKFNFRVLEALALLDLTRLYLYKGDLAKAETSLALAEQERVSLDYSLMSDLLIEKGLLKVKEGQFTAGYAALKEGYSLAEKLGVKVQVFLARLAFAEANYAQGKKMVALRGFNQSVQLAKFEGYDGLLVRELRYRPRLAELARKVAGKRNPVRAYLSGLLNQSFGLTERDRAARSLKVTLFGQFEIAEEGRAKAYHLGRNTTKAILAFFLLHPQRTFTWGAIAAWAWPESSEMAAHKAFKNALWEIRRLCPGLKNAIIYQRGQYCLNPDALFRVEVDALEFKELLVQAFETIEEDKKINLLERAVALYQSPLLPEVTYPWIEDLMYVFENQYFKALLILAEMHFQRKTYEISVTYCLKGLKVDELDEKAQHLLIANYLQLGQRSKALKQYDHFLRLLRKHLKSEPCPETTALLESFL